MAQKSYIIWLDDRAYIQVEFATVRGRVVSFVVRLMRVYGDAVAGIVRYDTAHGMPHRDILDSKGHLIKKDWLTGQTFEQALSYAKDDLQANYENYFKEFEEARDSKGR